MSGYNDKQCKYKLDISKFCISLYKTISAAKLQYHFKILKFDPSTYSQESELNNTEWVVIEIINSDPFKYYGPSKLNNIGWKR